ncbi:MAG: ribosomal protein modification protein RimK [Bacteroidetes bacterium]|nr:ribosomal protein modification protein RimK [Bacteroidota bacterium]
MKNKKPLIRLIGRREYVSFPLLGIYEIEAKIDTGAYTCAIHCEEIKLLEDIQTPTLFFTISGGGPQPAQEFRFTEFSTKKIKNSFGEMEERYIISTILKIGKKNIRSTISLTNRGNMRYPVLIGRKPLKGKFLIDVNQLHIGGPLAKKAIKKILL